MFQKKLLLVQNLFYRTSFHYFAFFSIDISFLRSEAPSENSCELYQAYLEYIPKNINKEYLH